MSLSTLAGSQSSLNSLLHLFQSASNQLRQSIRHLIPTSNGAAAASASASGSRTNFSSHYLPFIPSTSTLASSTYDSSSSETIRLLRRFWIRLNRLATRLYYQLITHPLRRSLSQLASRFLVYLFDAITALLSWINWLLLPKLAFRLLFRHTLALVCLYLTHLILKQIVSRAWASIYLYIRSFFLAPSYLQRERSLYLSLKTAKTYQEWKKYANQLDRLQGLYLWKENSKSPYYDWRRIRDDLTTFRSLVDNSDVAGIMKFSRARLTRNLVGINDRRLYTHLRSGTKRLIEEYISEVVRALQLVCMVDNTKRSQKGSRRKAEKRRKKERVQEQRQKELEEQRMKEEQDPGKQESEVNQPEMRDEDELSDTDSDGSESDESDELSGSDDEFVITAADKLSFFNETRHAFGRSALLLSGGATLGLYHAGVLKALHDNDLLPRVISGSSVGSIIVAMLGTRTDKEIEQMLLPGSTEITLNFFPPNASSVKRKVKRFLQSGVLMDIGILRECVKANVRHLTFQEAYDRSGRIINIVVSPSTGSGNQDTSRLLNYLTAPNVLVWSAALASCAIPGV